MAFDDSAEALPLKFISKMIEGLLIVPDIKIFERENEMIR